jgi:phosphatidylinositol glycan class U
MTPKVIPIPIAFGIFLRLLLMYYVKEVDFILISSPVSRFKSIKEGIYYYSNGLNPYEGVFKESPIILLLFSIVQNHYLQALIFVISDYLIAVFITKIAEWRKTQPLEAWLEATVVEDDDHATLVGNVDEDEDEVCLPKLKPNQIWKNPNEDESLIPKGDPTIPIDIPYSSSDIGR